MEIAVGIEKVLGDCAVCAGVGLAHEVVEVGVKVSGLGMRFGVGSYFDMEVIASLVADKFDQFVGITQFA